MSDPATPHFCDAQRPVGTCPACLGRPRPFVRIDSWAGRTRVEVEVLGRTPKRLRIRFLTNCAKGAKGDVRLVGHDVVCFPKENPP